MIDMITVAGICEYQQYRGQYHLKTEEDKFYAELGSSRLIRFAAWLTSIDLTSAKNSTATARCSDGCGAQATFLAPR